jgi:hypothetical protein
MITQQQRDLRNAIVNHANENNPQLDHHTEALIRVLGSVIEGIPVERALGSPGSWGYGTPIGDALLEMLKSKEAEQELRIPSTEEMVNRFLSWKLPETVLPDACVMNREYPHRTGTNLLSADEAREMIRHLHRVNSQFNQPELH